MQSQTIFSGRAGKITIPIDLTPDAFKVLIRGLFPRCGKAQGSFRLMQAIGNQNTLIELHGNTPAEVKQEINKSSLYIQLQEVCKTITNSNLKLSLIAIYVT